MGTLMAKLLRGSAALAVTRPPHTKPAGRQVHQPGFSPSGSIPHLPEQTQEPPGIWGSLQQQRAVEQ